MIKVISQVHIQNIILNLIVLQGLGQISLPNMGHRLSTQRRWTDAPAILFGMPY
jgi:hypothetical protein